MFVCRPVSLTYIFLLYRVMVKNCWPLFFFSGFHRHSWSPAIIAISLKAQQFLWMPILPPNYIPIHYLNHGIVRTSVFANFNGDDVSCVFAEPAIM